MIRCAAANGVKCLKTDLVELEFHYTGQFSPENLTTPLDPVQDSTRRVPINTPQEEAALERELHLENLQISDPLAYEEELVKET